MAPASTNRMSTLSAPITTKMVRTMFCKRFTMSPSLTRVEIRYLLATQEPNEWLLVQMAHLPVQTQHGFPVRSLLELQRKSMSTRFWGKIAYHEGKQARPGGSSPFQNTFRHPRTREVHIQLAADTLTYSCYLTHPLHCMVASNAPFSLKKTVRWAKSHLQ